MEHHFIVKYVSGMGWMWDIASEEARFPDGTVWDGTYWLVSDSSDKVLTADREISDQLTKALDIMNGE